MRGTIAYALILRAVPPVDEQSHVDTIMVTTVFPGGRWSGWKGDRSILYPETETKFGNATPNKWWLVGRCFLMLLFFFVAGWLMDSRGYDLVLGSVNGGIGLMNDRFV